MRAGLTSQPLQDRTHFFWTNYLKLDSQIFVCLQYYTYVVQFYKGKGLTLKANTFMCHREWNLTHLTVDDGELDGDGETLPLLGVLLDVLTDLLRRETQGTKLGGQSGRVSYLAPDSPKDHVLRLAWARSREYYTYYMIRR